LRRGDRGSKITAMRRVLWAMVLAGCFHTPPEVRTQIACTTICTCFAPQEGQRCVDACIADGDLGLVSDECFECIQTHANQCSKLEDDCDPLCAQAMPPTEDFPDGGLP
jgi:hypothetical protein